MNDLFFFLLYLFYGLAFFATGVAVTSKISRASKLAINRHLWLFAMFAFTHACDEWFELFLVLDFADLPALLSDDIQLINFLPAFISYCFLLVFGIHVLGMVNPGRRRWFWLIVPVLFGLLSLALKGAGADSAEEFFRVADQRMRNLVGFPSAALAGFGLTGYASKVRETSVKVARSFVVAGLVLVLYGVLTGLVPSGTTLPVLRVPVEVLRAATAIVMLHFMLQALRIFSHERQAMFETSIERFNQVEKLTSLGMLAAGIAHEINNPLTNVSLNLEMLKKSFSPDESQVKRFEAIERNLERASRIARELLEFSRQDQKEEVFTPLDLNQVLRQTLVLLGPRQHDFRLELDLARLQPVFGLPWKIEEVLLNVIINAMEASDRGQPIHLVTRQERGEAVLTVRDEGIGVPPENLRSLFDPFFTTKEVGRGTGLGLSICFGIMQRHGGKIDVLSKVGLGTTVILSFPTGGADAGQDSGGR